MKFSVDIQIGCIHISTGDTKRRQKLHQKGIWVTKEGQEIPVKYLDNHHLINIAKLLIRKAALDAGKTAAWYASCPEPNGEMAQDAFEQECAFWWGDGDEWMSPVDAVLRSYAIWPFIADEIEKRGLSAIMEKQ